jgi:hypothetical protein
MNIQQIRTAWESQKTPPCYWLELTGDEKLAFALKHIEAEAQDALHDLGVAVYDPDNSSISVAHAIGHVKQIFSA